MEEEKKEQQQPPVWDKNAKMGCFGCLGVLILLLGGCAIAMWNVPSYSDPDDFNYDGEVNEKDAAEFLEREIELEMKYGDEGNE